MELDKTYNASHLVVCLELIRRTFDFRFEYSLRKFTKSKFKSNA